MSRLEATDAQILAAYRQIDPQADQLEANELFYFATKFNQCNIERSISLDYGANWEPLMVFDSARDGLTGICYIFHANKQQIDLPFIEAIT